MKCVKHGGTGTISRVSDELAKKMVEAKQGHYTSKQAWKAGRKA